MNEMSSAKEYNFAVIGFSGAGKTTYACALYRAAQDSKYTIRKGEEDLKKICPTVLVGEGHGTDKGITTEICYENKSGIKFYYNDYAGESIVDKDEGKVTKRCCGTFIGDSEGAIILINPKEETKEIKKVGVEKRLNKYKPVIEYLASQLKVVCLVRTADDFYKDVLSKDEHKNERDEFDEFEKCLEKCLKESKQECAEDSKLSVKSSPFAVCCKGDKVSDWSYLFEPFEYLMGVCEKRTDTPLKHEAPVSPGDSNWPWFAALAVLCVLGLFTCLLWTGEGGENRGAPTETQGQDECGKNEGAHAESDGQVVENTVTKRLCAQCQSELDDAEDGTLCEECQRKQEEERRKKEEEERRQKRINEFSEELDRCPSVVDRIKCLNEVSDEIPAVYLVRYAEDVSDKVSEEYRGILARMRDFRLSLEEVIREDRDKMAGAVEYDKTNVDGLFSIFKELSATLCKTRNDTLKQNDWYCFIAESFKNKQLCDRCAECYQQKYEISDVSIKVESNPYRWVTVALSVFQYSGDVGKYEIRELVKKTDVVKKKKSCDWTSVWTDNVVCEGNPWRCCGMKFRFKGNNMGPGQAFHSAAKVLNDEVASYDADGLGRIEDELEFGGDEKKGAVKLRYRITFRRLNPEVKSPFSVEGVVK